MKIVPVGGGALGGFGGAVRAEWGVRGLTVVLLKAAVAYARKHGARVVEGFPLVPRSRTVPAAFAWTGFHSAFAAAGFEEVGAPSAGKRVMHAYVGRGRSP